MAIDATQFQKLKAKADELQREADRAAGAYDAAMARLAKEFNVKTLKGATKMADELEQVAAEAEAAYNAAYDEFLEEWGWVFDGADLTS